MRFKNKPIIEYISNRYGYEGVSAFRKFEKIDLKLRKLDCDLDFLVTCETNNLIPKFLKFKISLHNFRRDHDYFAYQVKLLRKEIESKRLLKATSLDLMRSAQSKLKESFSFLDFNHAINIVVSINEKKAHRFKSTHQKKLFNLGLRRKYDSLSPDKIIFNLSDKVLTIEQKEALSLGLNFCFQPKKIDYARYFLSFEKLFSSLSSNSIKECIPNSLEFVRTKLKSIALTNFIHSSPEYLNIKND